MQKRPSSENEAVTSHVLIPPLPPFPWRIAFPFLPILPSPEKEAVTSHVPFVALLTGRQSWAALAAELKVRLE